MVYSILNNLENNFPVRVIFNVKLYISIICQNLNFNTIFNCTGQRIENLIKNEFTLSGKYLEINGVFISVNPF